MSVTHFMTVNFDNITFSLSLKRFRLIGFIVMRCSLGSSRGLAAAIRDTDGVHELQAEPIPIHHGPCIEVWFFLGLTDLGSRFGKNPGRTMR